MRQDIKIKEIPGILRDVIYNTVLDKTMGSDEYGAIKYLKMINWGLEIEAFRLAYAQLMYPKGTKIKSMISDQTDIVEEVIMSDFNEGDIDAVCEHEDGRIIYDSDENEWAKIIEDGDIKCDYITPLQPEWRNPTRAEIEEILDSTQLDESEIKAGDMVEGSNDESKGKSWFGLLYFTGGKLITGEFICEIKTDENDVHTPFLRYFKRIRKYNPNRELENIVEQFMTEKHIPKGTHRMIYNGYKIKKLLVDFGLYTINQTK